MFEAVTGFIGSAAFGGITGLLGGVVNRVADYFTLKETNKQKLSLMDKELEIAKVEADKEVVLAKEKTMTEREIAEGKALEKSYDVDKASYFTPELGNSLPDKTKSFVAILMVFVDFIRGLTRPGITLYMCALTTLIYIEMQNIVSKTGSQAFTPEDAVGIIKLIVEGVIYLTTMAVGWWFATRAKKSGE